MRKKSSRISFWMAPLFVLVIGPSAYAQWPNKAPKDPQGPIKISLGEIPMDPAAMKVKQGQPIPFKPMEMVDPATGKAVSADYMIKLPSGKEITAGEYYAKVNDIERSLNEQGYSLRDQKSILVQKAAVTEGLLSPQKQKVEAAHLKTNLSPGLLSQQFGTVAVRSGEALNIDAAAAGINMKEIENLALEVKKLGLDMPTNRLIVDPQTLATLADKAGRIDLKTIDPPKGGEPPRDFAPVGTSNSWTSHNIGDPSQFAVNMTARLDVGGEARRIADFSNPQNDIRNFAIRSDVTASATIQNRPLELLRATGSIEDLAGTDTARARMRVSVAGRDVYNFDQVVPDNWQFDENLPTQTVDYNYHTSFAIWLGFQVGVTVGVRGEAGCHYNLSLLPTQASGRVTPYVHSNGYVQTDFNFVDIVGVGTGSDIVVLHDEMTLASDVTVGWLGGWYLRARSRGYNRLHALDGRLYAYAYLGSRAPCVTDPPGPFCAVWTFWNWSGVNTEGNMFTPYDQTIALR